MEKARVFKSEHAFVWAFVIGVAVIFLVKLIAQGQPVLGGFVASVLGIGTMVLYRKGQKQVRPEGEHPRLGTRSITSDYCTPSPHSARRW